MTIEIWTRRGRERLPHLRDTRLTPGSNPAGDSDIPGVQATIQPPARLPIRHSPGCGVGQPTVSRHEVSTVQVCCLRPVFRSVAHRAARSGRPQVLRLLVPSVCPASPLSPFRPGKCRRRADSDTNIQSGRSASCAIDNS